MVSSPETLEKSKGSSPGPEYEFGARFNFALFVDDICIESLEHMKFPMVKLLDKQWGHLSPEERNYEIHPDWHDGTTNMDEEDIGWIYMSTCNYVDFYDKCEWSYLAIWHTF